LSWKWAKHKALEHKGTKENFSHADELFVSWCIDQSSAQLEANVFQKVLTERIDRKVRHFRKVFERPLETEQAAAFVRSFVRGSLKAMLCVRGSRV